MTHLQKITREEAIEALARNEITKKYDRAGTLTRLHSFFDDGAASSLKHTYSWSQETESLVKDTELSQTYKNIMNAELIEEFTTGIFKKVSDPKYDEILIEWEKHDFILWDNKELLSELRNIGMIFGAVMGEVTRYACPCCGADTLPERQGWDICPVCWHEDSGFDNTNSSYSYVGADIGLHLYVQRINFLKFGISCPDRKDLAKKKDPIEKYNRSRFFGIDNNRNVLFEKNTDWSIPLTPPSYEEHFKEILKLPTFQLANIISKSYFWTNGEFDFSSFWDDFEKKVIEDKFSPSHDEIDMLRKNIGARVLLQEKFSKILAIKF